MERPSQRQWDPVAPSLLWAHELRREHVHLADQLGSTRANLTSTTDTVTDLAKKLDDVDHQLQKVHTRCELVEELRKAVPDELDGRIQQMVGRFEALEAENAQLKRRIEAIETEWADRVFNWNERFRDIMMRLPWKIQDPLPRRVSEVLAPDSMPVDQSALSIGPTYGLSDTTCGSSSPLDGRVESLSHQEEPVCPRTSPQCAMLKQDELSLLGYLHMAEGIGEFVGREKGSVETFVRGLSDSDTRAVIVSRLDASGWSWSCLQAIVREVAGVEDRAHADRRGVDACHDDRDRDPPKQKSKRKRKRRSIPIVPADEDDLKVLDWHTARR